MVAQVNDEARPHPVSGQRARGWPLRISGVAGPEVAPAEGLGAAAVELPIRFDGRTREVQLPWSPRTGAPELGRAPPVACRRHGPAQSSRQRHHLHRGADHVVLCRPSSLLRRRRRGRPRRQIFLGSGLGATERQEQRRELAAEQPRVEVPEGPGGTQSLALASDADGWACSSEIWTVRSRRGAAKVGECPSLPPSHACERPARARRPRWRSRGGSPAEAACRQRLPASSNGSSARGSPRSGSPAPRTSTRAPSRSGGRAWTSSTRPLYEEGSYRYRLTRRGPRAYAPGGPAAP
jgi:hypothetical protein